MHFGGYYPLTATPSDIDTDKPVKLTWTFSGPNSKQMFFPDSSTSAHCRYLCSKGSCQKPSTSPVSVTCTIYRSIRADPAHLARGLVHTNSILVTAKCDKR